MWDVLSVAEVPGCYCIWRGSKSEASCMVGAYKHSADVQLSYICSNLEIKMVGVGDYGV